MSAVPRFVPSYTVDDYQRWEGDWELWDGIAVSMSPSPFGDHQLVLFNLAAEIKSQLKLNQCDAFVIGELDWIVEESTVVRPDVMVGCGPPPSEYEFRSPSMVAEVLSPSTAVRDQTHKRDLYEQQGVSTYFIVDPKQQSIIHYALQANGKYEQQPTADELVFRVCEDCEIKLVRNSLFG